MNPSRQQTDVYAPATALMKAGVAQEQGLAEAFAAFNRLSEELAVSYRELEQKVERLSGELAAARSERLEELAEKERLANRLSRLLESLPGAVVVTDGAGVITEANPAAFEFLGTPLLGLAWSVVARRFERGGPRGGEATLPNGRKLSMSTRALGAEPGEILLLQDVTETSALREQLDRHRRLATMGEMAAGLAHQVRTPLSSVLLYLPHLERRDLDEAQRDRLLGKIRGRVQHLESLVMEMLQFARGRSMTLTPVRVPELIHGFEDMVKPLLDEAEGRLEIEWSAPGAALCLAAQREALLGALLNLATNAIHAAGNGARITLRISRPAAGWLSLTLADNGPGIPANKVERIFEPFFTTRTQGTGLGLAVVRNVIEAHGGEVRLDKAGATGASFTLRLPLIECPEAT
ncbi:MAG: ATP-binding protein [Gammaproteobacteria bacterium]|jgi:two-component system sensor histidine kinase FlrB